MIADQNFYDTCFTIFYPTASATATAKFSGPNIQLRPKVKIAPTVQHWLQDSGKLRIRNGFFHESIWRALGNPV